MMIGKLLADASARLRAAGVESAPLEAQLLLAHVMGIDRLRLLVDRDRAVPQSQQSRFSALLKRRCRREPLQYLSGEAEFSGRKFYIDNNVLIPRPETELLVEQVAGRWRDGYRSILDIGTGSGCIAIALAFALPGAAVTATDSSAKALAVARRNVRQHGLSQRVRLVNADLFPQGRVKYDCIVSNPPYIPSGQIKSLQPEVSRYEPVSALDGGEDGLACYRSIMERAGSRIKPGGMLAVEVGQGQDREVRELARRHLPGARIEAVKDYCGIERFILAALP